MASDKSLATEIEGALPSSPRPNRGLPMAEMTAQIARLEAFTASQRTSAHGSAGMYAAMMTAGAADGYRLALADVCEWLRRRGNHAAAADLAKMLRDGGSHGA